MLVEPLEAPAVLRDELRVEGAVAVSRHVEIDGADLGQHRLRRGAIAVVARPVPGRVTGLIAEMLGSSSASPARSAAWSARPHTVGAQQLETAGIDAGHHRVNHLIAHRR